MTFLPLNTYKTIVDTVPILCVDAIISNSIGEYLLIKRAVEPLKGKWWVPGGRVYKCETLAEAIKRKVREELGIEIRILGAGGYYEDHFHKDPLNAAGGLHTLAIVFYAKPLSLDVKLDNQSSEWGFFKELPQRLEIKPFTK